MNMGNDSGSIPPLRERGDDAERGKRGWLTALAVGLWLASCLYTALVADGAVALTHGFVTVILVGAAATVSVVRIARSRRYVLAEVYRAGERTGREQADVNSARSFSAGVEAGRLLPAEDHEDEE